MYNKKALRTIVKNLDKAKAPAKPKDIIVDPMGQWKYPGQKTRIPGGDITMQGVSYPVWAQPNVGTGQLMQPGQDYKFPGADYVDETPMAKKGGALKKYSRSLEAKNKIFADNPLTKKPKSKKKKIFDPTSKYYKNGGVNETPAIPLRSGRDVYETFAYGMYDRPGWQKQNGGEAWDAKLTDEEIQAYRDAGYVVEDLEDNTYQQGGYFTYGDKKYIKKDGKWLVDLNGKYVPLSKNVAQRSAVLDKQAKYVKPVAQTAVQGLNPTNVFANPQLMSSQELQQRGNNLAPTREGLKWQEMATVQKQNEQNKKAYKEQQAEQARYNKASGAGAGSSTYITPTVPTKQTSFMNAALPYVMSGVDANGNANLITQAEAAGAKERTNKNMAYDKLIGTERKELEQVLGRKLYDYELEDKDVFLNNHYNQETLDKIADQKYKNFLAENQRQYNNASWFDKAASTYNNFKANPIITMGNWLEGKGTLYGQAYGLRDETNPEYQEYFKRASNADDYWLDDYVNMFNPEATGYDARANYEQGQYLNMAGNIASLIPLGKASKVLKVLPGAGKVLPKVVKPIANVAKSAPKIINPINKNAQRFVNNFYTGMGQGTINKFSPLNLIPKYGKKISNPTVAAGNVLDDVVKSGNVVSSQSPLSKAYREIIHEANPQLKVSKAPWRNSGKSIFQLETRPNVVGSKLSYATEPTSRFARNRGLNYNNAAANAIPLSDPGATLYRRLPFSTRVTRVDPTKLANNQFQWATQGAGLQNLAERYGSTALGMGLLTAGLAGKDLGYKNAFMYGVGEANPYKYLTDVNPYMIKDLKEGVDYIRGKQTGGAIEMDADEDMINYLRSQGYTVEDVD